MIKQIITTQENGKITVQESTVTQKQYENYIGAVGFFRGLGGTERVTRDAAGRVVKIVSRSPDGAIRKTAVWKLD